MKDKFLANLVNFDFLILPDKVKNQNMQCLIETAIDVINPAEDEPIVLLQLTQPLRALSLIKDALQIYKSCPTQAVLSYVLGAEEWRVLDDNGNYQSHLRPAGDLLKIHDGAIYVFNRKTYSQLWDKSAKSAVLNDVPALIDIDYQSQFNPQRINELCRLYI